jgi:hypothetical protein
MQAYWASLAGACGHTYGANGLWQFCKGGTDRWGDEGRSWRENLEFEAGCQMRHLRALIESRPMEKRVPDQSLILAGQGQITKENLFDHVQAARADDGSYAIVYLTLGQTVMVDLPKLAAAGAEASVEGAKTSRSNVKAQWFNPRAGEWSDAGESAANAPREFTAPANGPDNDWVLVLDAV